MRQLLISILVIFSFQFTYAAKIKEVKKKSVLITLDGENIEKGQIFSGGNKENRVYVKISKVGKKSAIAKIIRGKPTEGLELKLRVKGKSKQKESGEDDEKESKSEASDFALGVLFGYGMDNMSVKTSTQTVSLTGSGFSYHALADYHFTSYLGIRGSLGMESMSVENTTFKVAGINAKAELSYLTFGAMGRYSFIDGDTKVFVGAGFSFFNPSSDDTNVVENVGTTTVVQLALGVDLAAGSNFYIPIQVDYGIFPSSEEVSTSIISARAGIMFNF